MEIVFYPDSGAPILLTGELSEEGMQGGEAQSQNALTFTPLVDAPGVAAQDFANTQKNLAFVIERTWETPGAAASYWLEHLSAFDDVPTGRVRFRSQETTGGVMIERWLNGAGIISVRGGFEGCASRFQYQIGGGRLTKPL